MKIYDLLWRREEKSDEKKEGKVQWENVGVLIENDGKRSIKLNLIPAANWDGWLVVKERKEKASATEQAS